MGSFQMSYFVSESNFSTLTVTMSLPPKGPNSILPLESEIPFLIVPSSLFAVKMAPAIFFWSSPFFTIKGIVF